ncbi:hypothetical protein [Francisella philomiragia]|uniref:hypothetical protein n=1 Tax=Francisella philomiragia TaxID=28110 RepID=UPI0019089439|nr:hypothetical protein [Francisella philomiragia]MBK2268302.1 hypothetical protein [Francisella philomiragia]MBK2279703.1 hypothetical protein [Francisella philomiragia]MBK2287613.1 hypothetical protein [Francisella philomiragia]MBK2289592.1 hypothetical protein [Francisella philomiragia]MBK2291490.1 hypothetical protein [Francisella philomiragia]
MIIKTLQKSIVLFTFLISFFSLSYADYYKSEEFYYKHQKRIVNDTNSNNDNNKPYNQCSTELENMIKGYVSDPKFKLSAQSVVSSKVICDNENDVKLALVGRVKNYELTLVVFFGQQIYYIPLGSNFDHNCDEKYHNCKGDKRIYDNSIKIYRGFPWQYGFKKTDFITVEVSNNPNAIGSVSYYFILGNNGKVYPIYIPISYSILYGHGNQTYVSVPSWNSSHEGNGGLYTSPTHIEYLTSDQISILRNDRADRVPEYSKIEPYSWGLDIRRKYKWSECNLVDSSLGCWFGSHYETKKTDEKVYLCGTSRLGYLYSPLRATFCMSKPSYEYITRRVSNILV